MARGMDGNHMGDENKWRELCQRIMSEKDPEKLWALVDELNKTLEEREQQLRSAQSHPEEHNKPDGGE